MNGNDRRAGPRLMTLCLGIACTLLALAGLAGPFQTASAALPPRPTPVIATITPTPKPRKPAGAWLELKIHLPANQNTLTRQQMWTAVQWQDTNGGWHDVAGWRGTPDWITGDVGSKVWWVAEKDFGTGPFRWIVYGGQDGEFLAGSEMFTLPEAVGTTLKIEVLSAP